MKANEFDLNRDEFTTKIMYHGQGGKGLVKIPPSVFDFAGLKHWEWVEIEVKKGKGITIRPIT